MEKCISARNRYSSGVWADKFLCELVYVPMYYMKQVLPSRKKDSFLVVSPLPAEVWLLNCSPKLYG